MAERSLLVRYVLFRERGDVDGERFAASDVDGMGKNSGQVFCDWVNNEDLRCVSDPKTNRLVIPQTGCVFQNGGVLVRLKAGSYGEEAELVEVATRESIRAISPNQAAISQCRAYYMVPMTGEYALFFYEVMSNRASGGYRLIDEFAKWWNRSGMQPYMVHCAVTTREAWLAQTDAIKRIEIRSFLKADDVADSSLEDIAYYSYSVVPKRNKRFPPSLYNTLEKNPKRALEMVGITRDTEISDMQVHVTLKGRDNRTKTYVIGDYDGGTSMRELLNTHDEPLLSDEEFVDRCKQLGATILDEMGQGMV